MALGDGNRKWIIGGGIAAAALVGGWLLFGGAGEGEVDEDNAATSAPEATGETEDSDAEDTPEAGAEAEDDDS